MILIDTYALIWLAEGNSKLGGKAFALIQQSDGAAYVSAMTYWEAAMLSGKKRFDFSKPVSEWLEDALTLGGIKAVAVTPTIAAAAGLLPGAIHDDPCDRIIIVTAHALGCPLVTADRKILAYAAAGHLQAIDARR